MANVGDAVVVYGQQIPVVAAVDANLAAHVPADEMKEWLKEAGFQGDESIAETAQSLQETGYDMPSAWTDVHRSELIEAGIGPGYINMLQAVFQRRMIARCGAGFVRVMQGSEKSDEELAAALVKAKNFPKLMVVTKADGYAPKPQPWQEKMTEIANWLRTGDKGLSTAVTQLKDKDGVVAAADMTVPYKSLRSLALGTVLTGEAAGMGELRKIVSQEALEAGCGLMMLRDVTATVLSKMAKVEFDQWRKPTQQQVATAKHLVESTVMEWTKMRERLRKRGKAAVDDEDIALESLRAWIEPCPEVRAIITHLTKDYGSTLTLAKVVERVALDSPTWLSEHTAGNPVAAAMLEESVFVAGDAVPDVSAKPSNNFGMGHCGEHQFFGKCNKPGCKYQHLPRERGRFLDAKDKDGRKECMYFAKYGKCTADDCQFAHIEVPGAKGSKRRYDHATGRWGKGDRPVVSLSAGVESSVGNNRDLGCAQHGAETSQLVHAEQEESQLAHTVHEALQLVNTVQESSQPAHTVQESSQPAHTVQESSQPAHTVQESSQPAHTVQESSQPVHTEQESSQPAHAVQESSQPVHTVQESSQPGHTVQESSQPAQAALVTFQPVHTVQESSQPAHIVQESSQPAHTVQELSQPAHTVQESSQPAHAVQEPLQPAHEMQESFQPTHAVQEPSQQIDHGCTAQKGVADVRRYSSERGVELAGDSRTAGGTDHGAAQGSSDPCGIIQHSDSATSLEDCVEAAKGGASSTKGCRGWDQVCEHLRRRREGGRNGWSRVCAAMRCKKQVEGASANNDCDQFEGSLSILRVHV